MKFYSILITILLLVACTSTPPNIEGSPLHFDGIYKMQDVDYYLRFFPSGIVLFTQSSKEIKDIEEFAKDFKRNSQYPMSRGMYKVSENISEETGESFYTIYFTTTNYLKTPDGDRVIRVRYNGEFIEDNIDVIIRNDSNEIGTSKLYEFIPIEAYKEID